MEWRFSWEVLAHLPTLRLFIFRLENHCNLSHSCRNLSAELRLHQSLLLLSWFRNSEQFSLRVPVPRGVVIDPTCAAECAVHGDHFEVKLTLLLPVQHALLSQFANEGMEECFERLIPLSLNSDKKNLSAGGKGVDFFCRTCSKKLTKQPIRHFIEMPSFNWREVADNWFGACCCSFGGISEKMVSHYINSYDCVEGSCLLDVASVIVNKHDIEGYIPLQNLNGCFDDKRIADEVSCLIDEKSQCRHKNSTADIPEVGLSSKRDCKVGNKIMDHPASPNKKDADLLSSPSADAGYSGNVPGGMCSAVKKMTYPSEQSLDEKLSDFYLNDLELNLNGHSESLEKPFLDSAEWFSSKDGHHCCNHSTHPSSNYTPQSSDKQVELTMIQQSEDLLGIQQNQKLQHICALGGGFMVRASNVLKDIHWVEFSCPDCSSLVGCYPSYESENIPVDGGVRLFKCNISTCTPVGAPSDIFRKYTLQRVFMNLLLESAEDELSYRIFVKDLKTRSPMLQLVITSSQSWFSTGFCYENDTRVLLPTADLQPVSKVLFSECKSVSVENSRILADWSTRNHAEEVFMMKHIIEELSGYLKSASCNLPISCSSFQGMALSSLER